MAEIFVNKKTSHRSLSYKIFHKRKNDPKKTIFERFQEKLAKNDVFRSCLIPFWVINNYSFLYKRRFLVPGYQERKLLYNPVHQRVCLYVTLQHVTLQHLTTTSPPLPFLLEFYLPCRTKPRRCSRGFPGVFFLFCSKQK